MKAWKQVGIAIVAVIAIVALLRSTGATQRSRQEQIQQKEVMVLDRDLHLVRTKQQQETRDAVAVSTLLLCEQQQRDLQVIKKQLNETMNMSIQLMMMVEAQQSHHKPLQVQPQTSCPTSWCNVLLYGNGGASCCGHSNGWDNLPIEEQRRMICE